MVDILFGDRQLAWPPRSAQLRLPLRPGVVEVLLGEQARTP